MFKLDAKLLDLDNDIKSAIEDVADRIDNLVDTAVRKKKIMALTFMTVILSAGAAWAITAPAATSFAYDVYDIGVNQIVNGPIGFVGGVAAMAAGAIMAIQQKILGAVPCILGGGVLLNADSLVTSLGMMV